MSRNISIAIIGILLIGAAGAFFFLNSQPQAQQVVPSKTGDPQQAPQAANEPAMKEERLLFKNVDGGQISLAEIQKDDKPLVIYFFATWCPTCESDLRALNSAYEKYQGKINVLVVGFDPSEDAQLIKHYKTSHGYSWSFAEYSKDAILHFKIVTQSTKIGIDAKGNVVFTDGYGVLSQSDWDARLEKLLK
ncbi:MAG: TlpA family protein disulfide reductase [Thaumarchaeota archaeon]|nr:TlpA family protein disulfide reductase [Nitrososphaerota archaeon]